MVIGIAFCFLAGHMSLPPEPIIIHLNYAVFWSLKISWMCLRMTCRLRLQSAISPFFMPKLTHTYTLTGGAHPSSSLDRWYVSARVSDWIRYLSVAVPRPHSDHDGVTVRLAARTIVVKHRKPRRVYPVAAVVHETA